MELSQPSDESKVLVIYTGGTIGMLVGQQGYVPEPYFLTETLRTQTRFHDPLEDSLFSHSSSVEGFREWSTNSGTTSPVSGSSAHRSAPVSSPPYLPALTLLVRSSRPIGAPVALKPDAQHSQPAAHQPLYRKVSDDIYEAHLPSLVTPRTTASGQRAKRIRYAILEWHPLLDSSNIEMSDWIRIATEIELNYNFFDAFVVLHGTDTMSYTSSVLSFLLEDLGKTVILTGAQIPLSQLRNDAVDNLLGALVIAGNYIIPECCLYFNHSLYRGNRVSKASSYDFNAFHSPNFPALVNVGIDIVINWNDVIRQTSLRRFKAHKVMSPHVSTLRLFPGITASTIRAFLVPPMRGVVLETYGAGNAPQRQDLMSELKEACDRGVVVIAITQCVKGSVGDAYETGRTLLRAGVVPGGDMTPECALAKLSYLLSKPQLSVSDVRDLVVSPLRGEVTRTRASPSAPSASNADEAISNNLESIQGIVNQIVHLATVAPGIPSVTAVSPSSPALDEATQKATAPWSWTASEASLTEASLLPFLIHLAAAKNSIEGIAYCLNLTSVTGLEQSPSLGSTGAGVVNCLESGSGRSPLHTAAMNGSLECVSKLLEAGALVHLRDALGHTALYYAARQGHEDIVDILLEAGANLSGSDIEGGFVGLAIQKATRARDERAIKIWANIGGSV
ncbi:asparaginase-domain-containing protein [Neolentinus lepideus HHB14362 ss-1]|uniref:asparaginase n=1 Tax=Neolentinus lepideus HHB14362 ss-1 TaxID=1314782 RepID=A0A165TFC2_9AGAM|nr:asparaginase-domain-containing protein [Neolentinus lepideus HHB14362 ss-1]